MCQRASNDLLSKKYLGVAAFRVLVYCCRSIEFVIYRVCSNYWSTFAKFVVNVLRITLRSSTLIKIRFYPPTTESSFSEGTSISSKSTTLVVNSRILPLLSLIRSSVSMIPDKCRQSLLLWSVEFKEALETFHSLRPMRRRGFKMPPTILLDRNHFLVLINGRSPPQIAPRES